MNPRGSSCSLRDLPHPAQLSLLLSTAWEAREISTASLAGEGSSEPKPGACETWAFSHREGLGTPMPAQPLSRAFGRCESPPFPDHCHLRRGSHAGLELTMSPQVKVSYFGQGEDGALGHSVLYLTGVGTYHLLALCKSPLSSVLAGEGLRGAECEPTARFLHHGGGWHPPRRGSSNT